MRPSVRRLQETYQDRIDFHILNIDDYANAPLVARYRVSSIPMIVMLDAAGEIFQIQLGYRTEDQLINAAEALLENHATTH